MDIPSLECHLHGRDIIVFPCMAGDYRFAPPGDRLFRFSPQTAAVDDIVHLFIGRGRIGTVGVGLLVIDPVESSALLERVTEFAVLFSLFTTGLKMRSSLSDPSGVYRSAWPPFP